MIKGNLTSELIDPKLSMAVGTTSLDVTQAVSDAISKRAGTKNWQKINQVYIYENNNPFSLERRELKKGETVLGIAKSNKFLFFKADSTSRIWKAPIQYFEVKSNMIGTKSTNIVSNAAGDVSWWDQIGNITTDLGKVIVAGAAADNAIKTGQASQPITNYGAPQQPQPTPPKKSSTALIVTPLILGAAGTGIGYFMNQGKGALWGAGIGVAGGLILGFVFRG